MAGTYTKESITLPGAVAMGTGVMIGAGIFALTGQIAQLAGPLFPLSFVMGAIVTAFSAYTYIKMSNAYPSAGGIAMILKKAYGPNTVAAGASLLMALSMVINESLVARTFGTGFYLTVALALVATASGLIASVFAVSRMLAMLTDMKMIPHSHFGMPGAIKDHTLVYTVVIAGVLTVFFDLSRIASLGAFFYLVMDMIIHFGVLRHLREEIGAKGWVLLTAISLDAVALTAFAALKWQSDALIVVVGIVGMALVFLFVRVFLARNPVRGGDHDDHREMP